jgi:hypothetical protein
MKRSDFLKLAGIGLAGSLISPALFTQTKLDILDDIDLMNMLSNGEEIKFKTFELRRTHDLGEYPNAIIHNNIFTMIGKQNAFIISYDFRGQFSFNTVVTKEQFLF